jgi:hypothetical protein
VDPSFDRKDFGRLSKYVEENNLTHPIFTILSPFPGTDLYDIVKETLITESFELIDFFQTVLPTKLPSDKFYEEFLGLYRRAYPFKNFIKSVVQRRALLYTSIVSMHLKVRKRMASLRLHHGLVRESIHV